MTFWLSDRLAEFLRIGEEHIAEFQLDNQRSKVKVHLNVNTFEEYFSKPF